MMKGMQTASQFLKFEGVFQHNRPTVAGRDTGERALLPSEQTLRYLRLRVGQIPQSGSSAAP